MLVACLFVRLLVCVTSLFVCFCVCLFDRMSFCVSACACCLFVCLLACRLVCLFVCAFLGPVVRVRAARLLDFLYGTLCAERACRQTNLRASVFACVIN